MLKKLHTDERYHSLLVYGVIGEHYKLNEDGIYFDGILKENRFSGWTGARDKFLSYKDAGYTNKQWRSVVDREFALSDALIATAPISLYDGFSLNITSISQIIKAMDEVKVKYFQPILCGVTNNPEADYEQALEKLHEAGVNEYLTVLEKQLREYRQKESFKLE